MFKTNLSFKYYQQYDPPSIVQKEPTHCKKTFIV